MLLVLGRSEGYSKLRRLPRRRSTAPEDEKRVTLRGAARFASASKLGRSAPRALSAPEHGEFLLAVVRHGDRSRLRSLEPIGRPKVNLHLSRDTATSGSGSNIAMKVSCAVIAEALTASISLGNNERSLRLGAGPATRPVAHRLCTLQRATRHRRGLRLSS